MHTTSSCRRNERKVAFKNKKIKNLGCVIVQTKHDLTDTILYGEKLGLYEALLRTL
jgi:hypothetical protein